MQIVSIVDNLYEMSKPVFWGKYEKNIPILTADRQSIFPRILCNYLPRKQV